MRKWANGFTNGSKRVDKRYIPTTNICHLKNKAIIVI
jgi:hypothetical protein